MSTEDRDAQMSRELYLYASLSGQQSLENFEILTDCTIQSLISIQSY